MSRSLETIADGDALVRRIPSNPHLWNFDDGRLRVSSVAFKPSTSDAGVSVDVRRLMVDAKDPVRALKDRPADGMIEFLARLPRSLGLDVVHAPLVDNHAHANIVGFSGPKAELKRLQKLLARGEYAWVCLPEGARPTND